MLAGISRYIDYYLPMLVWVVGIILSLANRWRNPKKFLMILISCAIFLSTHITQILYLRWWVRQADRLNYSSYGTLFTVLSVIGWVILFYAIFNSKINATEKEKPPTMKTSVPLRVKVRDIAIGFFVWIILSNLLFSLLLFLMEVDPDNLNSLIWLSTIIAILILLFKKRIWISTGVFVAFAINGISWIAIIFSHLGGAPSLGDIVSVIGFPLPAGIILLLIGQ